ncbi:hypothetical protein LTR10_003385 [Elasticomyces elasticus]|nr:hypothetical protein LTR10_003385 [Elasticomyces elasticus]KAK4969653.1 hypothetical protein LTR42_008925 [Elasticomyces elasticus]
MSITTDQYGNRYYTSQRHRKDDSSDCDDKPLKKKAQPKKHDRETGAERSEDDQPLKKKDNRSNHIVATAIESSTRKNLPKNTQPEMVEVNMSSTRPSTSESIEVEEEEEEYDRHAAISKEKLARYSQCYADSSEWLAGLEKHENALFDQAHELARRVAALMQKLNEGHRLPRLSIEEYGQPDFDELITAAKALPRDAVERREMFRRVREAILVQLAAVPHKIRRGLVEICESMQKPLEEIRDVMGAAETLEDAGFESSEAVEKCCRTLRHLKHNATKLYGRFLQDLAKLVAEFEVAKQELELHYLAQLGDEQQHRHTRAGYSSAAILVGHIQTDYDEMQLVYEAAFAAAAMLSPATFAYESWRAKS